MPTGAHNAAKTHCPHGHEYTEENTYIDPKGSRRCRECAKTTIREWQREHRAVANRPIT